MTNTTPEDIAGRLEAMEERLARLETLLVGLTQQLEHQRTDPTRVVAEHPNLGHGLRLDASATTRPGDLRACA